jgi:hypothetical protein
MWRVFWFPEMQIRIDDAPAESWEDETTGLTVHEIPPGHHVVRWSWQPFGPLRAAQLVSASASLVVLGLGLVALTGAVRRSR